MLWLPFYVTWVGGTKHILFFFMIEDNSIIFVLDHLYILIEKKIHNVEFSISNSKEVFELDRNSARRWAKHIIALKKFIDAFKTSLQRHLANVSAQVD